MTEVWLLGVVYSTLHSARHLWSLWWMEYEYRPYFHGDYDVLPYLIIMLKVNTGDSHIQTPWYWKDDTWVAILVANGRRMSRELKYIKTIKILVWCLCHSDYDISKHNV